MQVRTSRYLRLCVSLFLMGAMALAITLVTSVSVFACTPGTSTGTCTDAASLSASATGIYSDGTPTGTLTPPAVDGNTHTNGGSVNFGMEVSDFRGVAGTGAPNWSIGLSSAGVSVPTLSGIVTKPITMGTATGACHAGATCSGAAVVDKTGGSLSLNGTDAAAIASSANGDFGLWDLYIPGTFSTDATTVGGTFTASVTVALTTPV